jgi:two-component system OmpR family response regulator
MTAVACREGQARTRPRRGTRLAAMAVPMEHDGDIVGVLTAEIDPDVGDRITPETDELLRLLARQMTPTVAAQSAIGRPPAAPGAPRTASAPPPIPAAPDRPASPPVKEERGPVAPPLQDVRPRLSLVPPVPVIAAAAGSAAHALQTPEPARMVAGPELMGGKILAVPSAKVVVLGAVSQPAVEPSAPPRPEPKPAAAPMDDPAATLEETRSRFIAGFRKRCAAIDELIEEVEAKGADGPLVGLKQIVHRLSGLAVVVGMPKVGARAQELDRLLDAPQALHETAAVRQAFCVMQDAFAADLAGQSPSWAAASGPAVGAHVLLVTGDAPQAARMVEDLQGANYRVTLTGQGLRALGQAAADRPDLILIDVELGGELDGHDVCRRIKADPALAAIPVVLLASQASTADRMAGFALGADDYLVKPVQTVEMLLRVRWMLTRPVADRQPAPRAGGGLMPADSFVAAARDVLRHGAAALGLVRVAPAAMTDLAAIFSDDLRRKDLLGRYSETQLAVLMPGATAGVAARRIRGVLDIARAAGLEQACAGVSATGLSTDRFIEPMLAEAESALSSAHVEGTPVVVHGAGAAAERGSVLIVDDDPDVVHVIDARLKAAGLHTLVAFDGQQALHQVDTAAPAVVVLELMLPKRSGFDVLARLRELPEPRPRVVVVSSRSREEDVMRAFELGADDYLTKPFNPQELLARLARLLK